MIGKAILPFLLAGYNVLAIDLRNHGNSQDAKPISLGLHESEDVLAAVDWLRANAAELGVDPERVGLWGESMGAATSLLACQKDRHERRIKAVVSDSSYLNARGAVTFRMNVFGVPALLQEVYWWWMHRLTPWDITEIDVERAIQQIAVPVMITHGNRDRVVDFNDGVRLYPVAKASMETSGTPPAVSNLWHRGGHGASWKHPDMFTSLCLFFQSHV